MNATKQAETQALIDAPVPHYGCQASEECAAETSYPANMLRVWEGKVVCQGCWEESPGARYQDNLEDELYWSDIPAFVPVHERQIERLEETLKEIAENDFEYTRHDCMRVARDALADDDKAREGGA